TMTNGNVEQTAASSDGQVLTLKYKDGEKKIVVPSDAPIVVYVPAEKSELKPGANIFIAAGIKQPDGTLEAPRVNVGRGIAPPMWAAAAEPGSPRLATATVMPDTNKGSGGVLVPAAYQRRRIE